MSIETNDSDEIINLISKLNDLFDSIKNAAENEMAKNLSIAQFKSLLYSKDDNIRLNNQDRWCKLPEDLRNDFKNLFLNMVLTENNNSSQSIHCLGLIACAEISKQLWPDCFNVLMKNLYDSEASVHVKQSIFQTIGYIFKQSNHLGKILSYNLINELFNLILKCLQTEDIHYSVKLSAANIVFESFELTKFFHSEEDNLRLCLKITDQSLGLESNDKLKIAGLKYLDKFINDQYDSMVLKEQMEIHLIEKTFDIIEFSNDSDLVKYAIYLWICITKVELKYQIKNRSSESEHQFHMFTTYDLDRLIAVLLKHLCQENENQQEEWDTFKESAVCLMLLSACLEQEIIPHLLPFINNNLKDENWQMRNAALITFGCLLINFQNDDQFLKKIFHFDFEIKQVQELMNDLNDIVKNTATCLVYNILEKFPEKKTEFDENLCSSLEIDKNSFKFMLFKNEYMDFSADLKPNKNNGKENFKQFNSENPVTHTEEVKSDENVYLRSNSNNPVINLNDIKNAISKLRKVSINQETTDAINGSNVQEKNFEISNQTILEENYVITTNTNSNDLSNQVYVYEKFSNEVDQEEIISSIKQIDDVLESVSNEIDAMPVIANATSISDSMLLTNNQPENADETQYKGTVASITAVLVENLHLPAHELQEKNRKKNLKIIQTQPEVNTPEFFKIKLKHVETNFN